MAKFTTEQTLTIVAVQHLINEWANELDVHNGANIAALLTDDCSYTVRGGSRHGPAAVQEFYTQRLIDLGATDEGVPFHRHAVHNLRVSFTGVDEVAIDFGLLYFSTAGMASGREHADPALVADVHMICKRGADGDWRIAFFDSVPSFRRVLPA